MLTLNLTLFHHFGLFYGHFSYKWVEPYTISLISWKKITSLTWRALANKQVKLVLIRILLIETLIVSGKSASCSLVYFMVALQEW
jgi:hypothetical protein